MLRLKSIIGKIKKSKSDNKTETKKYVTQTDQTGLEMKTYEIIPEESILLYTERWGKELEGAKYALDFLKINPQNFSEIVGKKFEKEMGKNLKAVYTCSLEGDNLLKVAVEIYDKKLSEKVGCNVPILEVTFYLDKKLLRIQKVEMSYIKEYRLAGDELETKYKIGNKEVLKILGGESIKEEEEEIGGFYNEALDDQSIVKRKKVISKGSIKVEMPEIVFKTIEDILKKIITDEDIDKALREYSFYLEWTQS